MEDKVKTVKASEVQKIELVIQNDTNILGNMLGGKLRLWIDTVAAASAIHYCNSVAVTAAVDDLNFHHPIKLGDVVILKASVNRAFGSSMEVGVRVEVENFMTGEILHSNSAYLTFVSINRDTMKPQKVQPIVPETEEEKRRFEQALKRREQRLKEIHGIVH